MLFLCSCWDMVELVDSPHCCIMIFFGFLFACLATVAAQVQPINPQLNNNVQPNWQPTPPTKTPNKGDTVIENKNVNIIVNVDPKDVAKELWSLIQTRLDGREGRRSMPTQHTLDELERIVGPLIAPTRRSHRATAFEVAYALDHVVRKALANDHHKRPTIDDEIDTREIVAHMMYRLKLIIEQDDNRSHEKTSNYRRMANDYNDYNQSNENEDEDEDKLISVVIKVRRSELLQGKSVIFADAS